jgi:hypothetical protein
MDEEQRREAERIRKANQRAKLKAINEGKYIYTPVELAKQFLEKMQEPSLEELYLNEELSSKLTSADKRPLQNYVQYLKNKIKKDREEETKK